MFWLKYNSEQAFKFIIKTQTRCQECGTKNNLQIHHRVFRSEGGLDVVPNLVRLCSLHHTGIEGVHFNIDLDKKYKSFYTCPYTGKNVPLERVSKSKIQKEIETNLGKGTIEVIIPKKYENIKSGHEYL